MISIGAAAAGTGAMDYGVKCRGTRTNLNPVCDIERVNRIRLTGKAAS